MDNPLAGVLLETLHELVINNRSRSSHKTLAKDIEQILPFIKSVNPKSNGSMESITPNILIFGN